MKLRSIATAIAAAFRPRTCPVPRASGTCRAIRPRDLLPLAGFVVPTLVVGYGFVIPRSCIAGVNDLTVGFGLTIAGAAVTYLIGVRAALRR